MGNSTRLFLGILLYLFSLGIGASPTLPGEKCKVAPHSTWTEAESWAWGEICIGEIADFNFRYDTDLDPKELDGRKDNSQDRRISQRFIETILLYEPWQSAIPRHGIRFDGAYVSSNLDLDNMLIKHEIGFENSRISGSLSANDSSIERTLYFINTIFDAEFFCTNTTIGGSLEIKNSTFIRSVSMRNLTINGDLLIHGDFLNNKDSEYPIGLEFFGLRIGQNLDIRGSTFEGPVVMIGVRSDGDIFAERSQFKGPVILDRTQAAGTINFQESVFENMVSITGTQVGGDLFINSQYKDNLNLSFNDVEGQVAILDSSIQGMVSLGNSIVSGSVAVIGSEVAKTISLFDVKIGGNLVFTNSSFFELDLTQASISGEMQLGYGETAGLQWKNGGRLVLRNADVGTIQDSLEANKDSWPEQVFFEGFTYDRLGVLRTNTPEQHMLSRDVSWYIDWLARDPNYSPQPYDQLASIFKDVGDTAKANAILYAGRERVRAKANGATRFGLEMLKWTIGYGLGTRYFRALWWVFGLVIVGMLVLRISSEGRLNKMPYGISFSLDHLLPIVTLRKYHFDITLNGWPRYYFYFHKLMGYVLASFLIAGMAGLTQ